jgi:hypothetical protein
MGRPEFLLRGELVSAATAWQEMREIGAFPAF